MRIYTICDGVREGGSVPVGIVRGRS